MHRVMAQAELEHASQESEEEFNDLSCRILAERKNMQADAEYQPELWELLEEAWALQTAGEPNEDSGIINEVESSGDASPDTASHSGYSD